MRPNQALSQFTVRLLSEVDEVLQLEKPGAALVQGETTTVMTVALACFYQRVPVGHVEAGLRTDDLQNPFPEEANCIIAGHLARWHFAPTENSFQNLLQEVVPAEQIHVTCNTIIDALLMTAARDLDVGVELDVSKRLVLVTSHRRENFGDPYKAICRGLRTLAEKNSDIEILYPVHPNPNAHNVAHEMLDKVSNARLWAPLDHPPFIAALKRAYLVISDSGGAQEEVPVLGEPVLVFRDKTERPEAVAMGVVRLVEPHEDRIVTEAQKLPNDPVAYSKMARGVSPYGDGKAAARIVNILARDFYLDQI